MSKVKNTPYGLLFLGDLALLSLSLYATLTFRYWEAPGKELLANHFTAFSALFIVWMLVFFVAGLYDRRTLFLPESLWQRILRIQIVNSFIAVLFFYTIPFFGIAPKTNLFIYLVVSFVLLVAWRYWAQALLSSRIPQQVLLISPQSIGKEVSDKLARGGYGLKVVDHLDPDRLSAEDLYQQARSVINSATVSFVVIDMKHKAIEEVLPKLHNFLYANIDFITLDSLYELIFDRVAMDRLDHEWLIKNIHQTPHTAYDTLKRIMDISIACILGLLSLPFYVIVAPFLLFSGEKTLFSQQERLGQGGKSFTIYKFRTMLFANKTREEGNRVTKIGELLRKTRIDELPQILNVITGDMSFIGPRPEFPGLVDVYVDKIPYFNARHLIKPGISGWAQLLHTDPPKHEAEVEKARMKLAYDFYYVKNRSFMLDVKIALWTLRVLASRSGK